eukprot:c6903_g1_i1.p1 GENE.c6903_g1_i1~~c6903_g1_i1.p1  ORF type:complete len:223 (-),score=50.26 c6903_g1_i1:200-868(-)
MIPGEYDSSSPFSEPRVHTTMIVHMMLIATVSLSVLGSSERDGDYNVALALFGFIGAYLAHAEIIRAFLCFDLLSVVPDFLWLITRGNQIRKLHGSSAEVGSEKFTLVCTILVFVIKLCSLYFVFELDRMLHTQDALADHVLDDELDLDPKSSSNDYHQRNHQLQSHEQQHHQQQHHQQHTSHHHQQQQQNALMQPEEHGQGYDRPKSGKAGGQQGNYARVF